MQLSYDRILYVNLGVTTEKTRSIFFAVSKDLKNDGQHTSNITSLHALTFAYLQTVRL